MFHKPGVQILFLSLAVTPCLRGRQSDHHVNHVQSCKSCKNALLESMLHRINMIIRIDMTLRAKPL